MIKNNEIIFYQKEESGKIIINRTRLFEFLEANGFYKLKNSDTNYSLIRIESNVAREILPFVIKDFIAEYLKAIGEKQVLEAIMKQTGLLAERNLEYLPSIELGFKRGTKDKAFFYFNNGYLEITEDEINLKSYNELDTPIWEQQIIKRDIDLEHSGISDFFVFVNHLADGKEDRFRSLNSIIGYLLHSYKNPSFTKAIVFTDQTIDQNGRANGGTGKSLLMKGISQMVKMVQLDGKNLKLKSNFIWQQITKQTEILYLDDVLENFSFENLYSSITEGLTVEKKYQGEVHIPYEEAPKIVISSNYVVKGTGGNSDERRRIDFELSDYYRTNPSPTVEFSKPFFTSEWTTKDWNSFYHFMFYCVQLYLRHGVIEPESINLELNRFLSYSNHQFLEFATRNLKEAGTYEKELLLDMFKERYSGYELLTSHTFTKWIHAWGDYKCKSLKIEQKQSNGRSIVVITTLQQ